MKELSLSKSHDDRKRAKLMAKYISKVP